MAKAKKIPREHLYHAEAVALSGNLHLPLLQEIKPQTSVKLHEKGGYISQHSGSFRLEGILSYKAAYTQVAGNRDPKRGHGWSTLTTSVVEGINVLEVVTADRVVTQLSSEHPLEGYVPSVSFLGTRFENLRIAGHPVDLELALDVLGPKPGSDFPYTSDKEFLKRVSEQLERIRGVKNLSAEMIKRYSPTPRSDVPEIECSILKTAKGGYPGQSFGHVIDVPNFGRIYLGVLRIRQSEFEKGVPKKTTIDLTMIDLEMGCIGGGRAGIGNNILNGSTQP
jgi:hypothetical protein